MESIILEFSDTETGATGFIAKLDPHEVEEMIDRLGNWLETQTGDPGGPTEREGFYGCEGVD
jgi:hypothetical protein